jgi:hypothetical protein
MTTARNILLSVCLAYILPIQSQSFAQTSSQSGFEQSTAILDTGVLFAIGAREADQAIRGAFGWPTFQEGFVEGVYFRFDPDGYARFSPSPRLDEDVFEIVCAKASTACIAKKNVLEVGLTPSGEIQIRLGGVTPQDSYFISDRKSELPLPPSILSPLAPRLESLLSSGGELIVKREVEVIQTISLVGFSAVATYLRWVSQNQSPRVFPRGWPVPAQSISQTSAGLTQPDQWVPPNSGPQKSLTTWEMQQQRQANSRSLSGTALRTPGTNTVLAGNYAQAQNEQTLASLQSQILALQKNLQGIVNESPAVGISQRQNIDPMQKNDDIADYGRAFAQQARGRSLPELPGGLGVGGDTNAIEQPERSSSFLTNAPARQAGQFGLAMPEGGQTITSMDMRLLLRKIEQLEASIQMLRRDLSVQIVDIKEEISRQSLSKLTPGNTQVQLSASSEVKEPVESLGQISSAQPRSGQSRELLAKLEETLLQRLAAQNQGRIADIAPSTPPVDSASMNRRALEELLGELSSQVNTRQSGTEAPVSEPAQSNDFITLDAYINQVLRKEGLQKTRTEN